MASCRGVLRGFGKGVLELSEYTLIFFVSKGVLRKKKVIIKEISLSDIIDVKHSDAELTITWRSQYTVRDTFVADEGQREALTSLARALEETLRERERKEKEKAEMEERRREEFRKKAEEQRKETIQIFLNAAETIDALFGILRSLESRAKWDNAEDYLESFIDSVKSLQRLIPELSLDFTKISLAVKGHYRQETIDEAYSILSNLYDYFVGMKISEQNEELKNIHPNPQDMKNLILAYYMLNDIVLGVAVEDENIQKEIDHFLGLIEKMKNDKVLQVEIDEIKETIYRLFTEGEKETIIEQLRKFLLFT